MDERISDKRVNEIRENARKIAIFRGVTERAYRENKDLVAEVYVNYHTGKISLTEALESLGDLVERYISPQPGAEEKVAKSSESVMVKYGEKTLPLKDAKIEFKAALEELATRAFKSSINEIGPIIKDNNRLLKLIFEHNPSKAHDILRFRFTEFTHRKLNEYLWEIAIQENLINVDK